jgi:hypothetical protein
MTTTTRAATNCARSRRPLPPCHRLLCSCSHRWSLSSMPSLLPLGRRRAFCCCCIAFTLSIVVNAINRRAVRPRRFGPPCAALPPLLPQSLRRAALATAALPLPLPRCRHLHRAAAPSAVLTRHCPAARCHHHHRAIPAALLPRCHRSCAATTVPAPLTCFCFRCAVTTATADAVAFVPTATLPAFRRCRTAAAAPPPPLPCFHHQRHFAATTAVLPPPSPPPPLISFLLLLSSLPATTTSASLLPFFFLIVA